MHRIAYLGLLASCTFQLQPIGSQIAPPATPPAAGDYERYDAPEPEVDPPEHHTQTERFEYPDCTVEYQRELMENDTPGIPGEVLLFSGERRADRQDTTGHYSRVLVARGRQSGYERRLTETATVTIRPKVLEKAPIPAGPFLETISYRVGDEDRTVLMTKYTEAVLDELARFAYGINAGRITRVVACQNAEYTSEDPPHRVRLIITEMLEETSYLTIQRLIGARTILERYLRIRHSCTVSGDRDRADTIRAAEGFLQLLKTATDTELRPIFNI